MENIFSGDVKNMVFDLIIVCFYFIYNLSYIVKQMTFHVTVPVSMENKDFFNLAWIFLS